MPIFRGTQRSKETPHTTSDQRNGSADNHEAAQADQKPRKQRPTFQEREQTVKETTKERRAAAVTHQALKKKEQAAERRAAARREAVRQEYILQKQLVDRYGYSSDCPSSVAKNPRAIELSPISRATDNPSEFWRRSTVGNGSKGVAVAGGTVPERQKDPLPMTESQSSGDEELCLHPGVDIKLRVLKGKQIAVGMEHT